MSHNNEVRFEHDFFGVVDELEVSLCIDGEDYATRDIDSAIVKIRQRIQKQYSIDLNAAIGDNYLDAVMGTEIKAFLDNMHYLYNNVCGCGNFFRYIGGVPICLSNVNYLGITKDSMLSVLKLLQIEGRHDTLTSSMNQIKAKIGTVPMSLEKKLFMILYVSFELELYELSAAIAEILYIGGL